MSILAIVLVVLVALLHLYFLVLEMFLWTRPIGLKVFRQSIEKAEQSKVLAANQGLYNGFLAAGLLYGVATGSRQFCLFFLACVVVAGIYGAATVNRRIFLRAGLAGGAGDRSSAALTASANHPRDQPRASLGDTHIAMWARNTVSPCRSVTTTVAGRS